jgi:hypothetical protein
MVQIDERATESVVMEEFKELSKFSLLGGPLYRLGCRLGLVRNGTDTFRMGLVLGLFLWTILVVLAFYSGFGYRLTSLAVLGAHVRLLIVIPLLFLAESWIAPRWSSFISQIVSSHIAPQTELPRLDHEIKRITRWKDSWLPETVLLVAAVMLSNFGSYLPLHGNSMAYTASQITAGSAAAYWYWVVCMPIFRFLLLRWGWRLFLWTHLLWRVAKLKLVLIPVHPDSTAGLGGLEVVHTYFSPLILALSAVQAASFAEEISQGTMSLESVYPAVALTLVIDAVLFLGPLFIFTPKLWACQLKGRRDYGQLAENYVTQFDRKWVRSNNSTDEPLLGSSDIQSLADLANSISIIRNMRLAPIGKKLLISFGVAALAPMLPLLLLKYPIAELTQKFFANLTGM